MTLYSVASMLSISTSKGSALKLTNGFLTADNEYEALGFYVRQLRTDYQDYAIRDVLVIAIPDDYEADKTEFSDDVDSTIAEDPDAADLRDDPG